LSYPEARVSPLNASFMEVLASIQGKEFVRYPLLMKLPPNTHTSKKYCFFHKDKGHDIKDCYVLKKEIKRLIAKGYLR
jgi:hypothetical protein